MPATRFQSFVPATDFGRAAGLISSALLGRIGAGDRAEADASLVEQRNAHADLYRAQVDKARSEAEKIAAELAARKAAEQELPGLHAARIAGDQTRGQMLLNSYRTGQFGPAQYAAEEEFAAPPAPFTGYRPGMEAQLADALYLDRYSQLNPGNDPVGSRATAERTTIGNRLLSNAATGGAVDPQQMAGVGRVAAALAGKGPMENLGNAGVFDQFDTSGRTQVLNPIGNSQVGLNTERVNTERTKQTENTAQAGAANASAGLSNARRDIAAQELRTGIRLGPPVAVSDAEIGTTLTSPWSANGRPPAARPVAPGREGTTQTFKGYDDDGNPVYEIVPKTVGSTVTKGPRPERPEAPPMRVDPKALEAGQKQTAQALGKSLNDFSPAARGIIAEAFSRYYQESRNAGDAASRAAAELRERVDTNRLSKDEIRPKGGAAPKKPTGPIITPGGARITLDPA